jgi:hypothetical protein
MGERCGDAESNLRSEVTLRDEMTVTSVGR